MHEQNVCIGDIYQIGECRIQVSGPRMPCFKIAEKFKTPKLDKFVAKHAIHGWYYRVLTTGTLQLNDTVELIERPNPIISIAKFLEVVQGKETEQALVLQCIEAQDLDPEWRERLVREHSY
ncbi:MOSC domain-containing protein [Paraglaciecola aquimarina]|uniref:MOSC domain-containing protein n=1 Tax=Paraglaciecola aquimarina TaxID=1235557 RepID=A0ABU3SV16_9ALTE|nr:MOSC domain-containing protein [Paraglaciecola aquimarina]MDU0353844.1 MOSC domain-containing protein [Paraglaciecola aquimarina]